MTRYEILVIANMQGDTRHVVTQQADGSSTSFPAIVGNPNYDSFLESQSLMDAEVQAMTPDIWHDMA